MVAPYNAYKILRSELGSDYYSHIEAFITIIGFYEAYHDILNVFISNV